jgi:hypothetical protein
LYNQTDRGWVAPPPFSTLEKWITYTTTNSTR